MANPYDQIEDACVTQLASLTPDVEVLALPDNELDYKRGAVKSRITICAVRYTYGEDGKEESNRNLSIATSIQQEIVYVEIVVQSKRRREDGGINQIFWDLNQKLLGFKPYDCDDMYLLSSEVYRDKGLFKSVIVYRCSRNVVADIEDPTGPLLQEINFDENIT